jgi:hypothetical protein
MQNCVYGVQYTITNKQTNKPINQLTPWRRVLLEKLIVIQLVKKFPAIYGTQMFITMFTRESQMFLS